MHGNKEADTLVKAGTLEELYNMQETEDKNQDNLQEIHTRAIHTE